MVVRYVRYQSSERSFLVEERRSEIVVNGEVVQDFFERNLEQHIEAGEHPSGGGALRRRRVDGLRCQLTNAGPHERRDEFLFRRLSLAAEVLALGSREVAEEATAEAFARALRRPAFSIGALGI